MPRTKRPVRVQEKTGVKDDVLKKLDKIVAEQKANIDARVQMECRNVDLAFKMLLGTISSTVLNKTVGQLKNELLIKEVANTTRKTRNSSRATSNDDGYLTETSQGSAERGKKMAPPSSNRASRSRSADASARKMAAAPRTDAKPRRRSRSAVYKTPAYNKTATKHYPDITPKVAPQTPLTLLRHARQGEMLVSMSGSPVMPSIGSMATDGKAHCNFMLKDGTMLSLQPNQLRQSQAFIPFSLMDANVLNQLKTLQDNLAKVVKMGENVVKT
ncbi:uncharacterized protein LOC125237790 isoform X1 [Leguminivora glycinivorella]|uniref:uncharacterized protein LOC125237790 isoform X1 n=1 Tax=Leguminivora glycinivorella TaxID=1035111 RepID=UPI00200C7EA3|nr:uncharacterized protein LOC125237790 isoform X1 [Leguminivora glycinivorella]